MDYWFYKYASFLKKNPGIQYISGDFSFYQHLIEENLQGMLEVYVDETVGAGNNDFMNRTEKHQKNVNKSLGNSHYFYLLE